MTDNTRDRLLAAMQRKVWNQSELARACNALLPSLTFDRETISHYVRGNSTLSPERLAIMLKALGVGFTVTIDEEDK